jgi:hypothetical protein
MPLKRGSSRKTISSNIAELHTGKTYARTKAKLGKAVADRQAVAIAMHEAHKHKPRLGRSAGNVRYANGKGRA